MSAVPIQAHAERDPSVVLSARAARRRRDQFRLFVSRVLLAILVLAAWQFASGPLLDPMWISSPKEVATRLIAWIPTAVFWQHVLVTLIETCLGFLLGTASGVVLGVALGLNERCAKILDPFILALYSLPKVALAPLFILWFGFGLMSKVVLSTVGVFFLVFYNTYAGTVNVDRELIDSLRLMGARKFQVVRKVIFPSALLWIFVGMKVSVPYALIGAVVGEMMASNRGLGFIIQSSAGQYDVAGVFAALVALMIISTIIQAGLTAAERRYLRWQQ